MSVSKLTPLLPPPIPPPLPPTPVYFPPNLFLYRFCGGREGWLFHLLNNSSVLDADPSYLWSNTNPAGRPFIIRSRWGSQLLIQIRSHRDQGKELAFRFRSIWSSKAHILHVLLREWAVWDLRAHLCICKIHFLLLLHHHHHFMGVLPHVLFTINMVPGETRRCLIPWNWNCHAGTRNQTQFPWRRSQGF